MKNLKLLSFFALTLFAVSCTKTPVAEFSVDNDNPKTGEEVTFTNSTVDGVSYSWDFGDGETSDVENPTHTYESFGDYTATLTAYSKKEKKTDEVTVTIDVDKNTTEMLVGTWRMNTLDVIFYEDQIQVGTVSVVYNSATLVYTDASYVTTGDDGATDTGTWNVITEFATLNMGGDVTTIVSLTETTCVLTYDDIYTSGSVSYTDKITINMTKQ